MTFTEKTVPEIAGPKIDSAEIMEAEPDRATVHANGIVVDVTANDDGTVYIEAYAYDSRATTIRGQEVPEGNRVQAVVDHAEINGYKTRTPNLRLSLAYAPVRS